MEIQKLHEKLFNERNYLLELERLKDKIIHRKRSNIVENYISLLNCCKIRIERLEHVIEKLKNNVN